MSFILDALSKSEQARLQSTAAPSYSLLPTMCEEATPPRRWPLMLAAAIALNASLLFYWRQSQEPSPTPAVLHSAMQAKVLPEPEDLRADAPLARAHSALPAARTPAPALVHQEVAMPAGDPATVKPLASRVAEEAVLRRLPVSSRAEERNPVAAPVAAEIASKAAERDEAAELPERQASDQRELPPIAVAGFIRNEGSASMVIVNDKLAREGDEVSSGLTLEKIIGDRVLFNFKGYRFVR